MAVKIVFGVLVLVLAFGQVIAVSAEEKVKTVTRKMTEYEMLSVLAQGIMLSNEKNTFNYRREHQKQELRNGISVAYDITIPVMKGNLDMKNDGNIFSDGSGKKIDQPITATGTIETRKYVNDDIKDSATITINDIRVEQGLPVLIAHSGNYLYDKSFDTNGI